MATQTLAPSPSSSLLRRALQGDGIFSAVSGIALTVGANPIAAWMGLDTSLPILVLGMGLLIWGIGLFAFASREAIDHRLPITVIVANGVWVIGSVVILAADLFALTTEGRWAILVVADIVAVLAIAEFVGLRRIH